jgi:hypothetical protein
VISHDLRTHPTPTRYITLLSQISVFSARSPVSSAHNLRLVLSSSNMADKKKFKIAVLTSGGDSAGMNAAVRAVVKGGISKYVRRMRFSTF